MSQRQFIGGPKIVEQHEELIAKLRDIIGRAMVATTLTEVRAILHEAVE